MSGEKESPIRILIADDHHLFRVGLRYLLETNPNLVIVGEAGDGPETIAQSRQCKPDCVLLDFLMPKMSCFDVLRELKKLPNLRVLVLTAAIEKRQVDEVLELGARGVILKGSLTDHLFQAIQTVMAGDIWLLNKATKRSTAKRKAHKTGRS